MVVHEVMRMKGVWMNEETSQVLNPKSMVELSAMTGEEKKVQQYTIKRDFYNTRLYNAKIMKTVKSHSRKRWVLPLPNDQFDTLPYGYCE